MSEPSGPSGPSEARESRQPSRAKHKPRSAAAFPVVGIGASAGGMNAFTELIQRLSPDSGMAFVVIQHLDPKRESHLARLLAKTATLPVCEATDGQAVAPDHVYVIPPNADLTIRDGLLRLSPRDQEHKPHLAIDIFFRSLASDRGSNAIGVVLSGSGSDGTLGLAAIKEADGITFTQDEQSAEFASMPSSAIAYGCVDFVLPPAAIADELIRIGSHAYLRPPGDAAAPPESSDGSDEAFRKILEVLRSSTGIDFSRYRPSTIKRRILRRMAIDGHMTIAGYLQKLEANPRQAAGLLKDVLINVTGFFRDAEVFAALRATVLPKILKGKSASDSVRIWVVGCSTGQEVYSLAMELLDLIDDPSTRPTIQIFASDISEDALAKARAGIYPEAIEAEVPPERLKRYFIKVPEGYRIIKPVRELCLFARHDVIQDVPFSKLDLVTCRNVLIYMSPALQGRLMTTFHYSLNPQAFLVLGTSETVGGFTDLFDTQDQEHHIYLRRAGAARPPALASPRREDPSPVEDSMPIRAPSLADLQRAADRIVLGRYCPAGVLIDENLDILEFRGDTGRYLEPARGRASLRLLKMVPRGMAKVLAEAIEEASQQQRSVRVEKVPVRKGEQLRLVDVEVVPVQLPGCDGGCSLILFEERAPPEQDLSESEQNTSVDARIDQLRQELAAMDGYLQNLVDDNANVQEQLREANQDAISRNEELRCANEELQTTKEELESANEEMSTVNEELHGRNVELNRLTDDLSNVLDSIDLPVVMLDAEKRIRRFNSATKNLVEMDIDDLGRDLGSMLHGVLDYDMNHAVAEVMSSAKASSTELCDRNGHWYTTRINPYRTSDQRIEGTVVSLVDIDDIKRGQQELAESAAFSLAIVETVRDPLLILNADLRVEMANRAFYATFHLPPEGVEGELIYRLDRGQWDIPELRRLLDDILREDSSFDKFEVNHEFSHIGRRCMLLNARRLHGDDDRQRRIVLAIADVTEQTKAMQAIKETSSQLARSNAQLAHFAEIASHDLQAPLRMISVYLDVLQRDHKDSFNDESRQYMQRIVLAAARMRDLIKGVMEYSIAGQDNKELLPVDSAAVLRSTLDIIDLDEATVQVEYDRLPTVLGDAAWLGQLFQNLIVNALKFRSDHRPLLIGIDASHGENEWIFKVADNGIGIKRQDHERVFALFERAHSGPDLGGRGIGLATCRQIVERHGGRMWLESTPDIGTTFFFTARAIDSPDQP